MSEGAPNYSERLEAVRRRIEALVDNPNDLDDFWGRLGRPLLRVFEWQPTISTDAAVTLVGAMQLEMQRDLSPWLDPALLELESNAREVTRACVVEGAPPVAYVSWLWRMYQVVARAVQSQLEPEDGWARKVAAAATAAQVHPPLVPDDPGAHGFHAGMVDALLDAATAERGQLARRRRLLEVARRMLLDAAVASDLPADGVADRHRHIAQEIRAIDRLQAAGVKPDVGLVHQARDAVARGNARDLHCSLAALDFMATRDRDERLGRASSAGLDRLQQGRIPVRDRVKLDRERSARQMLSEPMLRAVRRGWERAQAAPLQVHPRAALSIKNAAAAFHRDGLGAHKALTAALSVDGMFDVGGTLSPQRVIEEIRVRRAVRHPTQELTLLPAERVQDIQHAVLRDPRLLLLQFATGSLLTRRYVQEERLERERSVMRTQARIFLLDGSTSMCGPRARLRDAVLIAELATLMERLNTFERDVETVVYFRYFDLKLGPLFKVRSAHEAIEAIEETLSTVKTGGTNIEEALVSSMQELQQAQQDGSELARAQIVLITDGESWVNLDTVWRAREQLGELPVGVSILALGEENEALRQFSARQRAQGEPVFYQHVRDREIVDLLDPVEDRRMPIHLPEGATPADLQRELAAIVEDMATEVDQREVQALEHLEDMTTALDEVGLSMDSALLDSHKARAAALHEHKRGLRARFVRWFPDPNSAPTEPNGPGQHPNRDALDRTNAVLHAVAEVVDMIGSRPLARQADAIEIAQRLLLDAGLAPWHYQSLLRSHAAELGDALAEVHRAAHFEADPPTH